VLCQSGGPRGCYVVCEGRWCCGSPGSIKASNWELGVGYCSEAFSNHDPIRFKRFDSQFHPEGHRIDFIMYQHLILLISG